MLSGHDGTSSSLTSERTTFTTDAAARPEPALPAFTPARAAFSTVAHCRAAPRATRSARSVCSRERSSLTMVPVSIPSGQESLQMPSAAHVCSPSYSYSSSSARCTGEPGAWRAISRRRTMRWRGVTVRSRLGQTGSQKPHSTQVVVASSMAGESEVCRYTRRG